MLTVNPITSNNFSHDPARELNEFAKLKNQKLSKKSPDKSNKINVGTRQKSDSGNWLVSSVKSMSELVKKRTLKIGAIKTIHANQSSFIEAAVTAFCGRARQELARPRQMPFEPGNPAFPGMLFNLPVEHPVADGGCLSAVNDICGSGIRAVNGGDIGSDDEVADSIVIFGTRRGVDPGA